MTEEEAPRDAGRKIRGETKVEAAGETKHAVLQWVGGMRFDAGAVSGPVIRVDGDNETGPGPMTTLLLAIAGCSGSDVVSILEKMRVRLAAFSIEIAGTRRVTEPRRYVAVHLVYRLRGEGLDEARARRAIDLSIEKYCSVMHSLAADLRITYDLALG
jgi:putative redox protein